MYKKPMLRPPQRLLLQTCIPDGPKLIYVAQWLKFFETLILRLGK